MILVLLLRLVWLRTLGCCVDGIFDNLVFRWVLIVVIGVSLAGRFYILECLGFVFLDLSLLFDFANCWDLYLFALICWLFTVVF